MVNKNKNQQYVELYPEMLNLVGIRRFDSPMKVVRPSYSMNESDVDEIIKNGWKINLNGLTEFEQRSILQILDEDDRKGQFVRVKMENHLEMLNGYLNKLVYYVVKSGVEVRDGELVYK